MTKVPVRVRELVIGCAAGVLLLSGIAGAQASSATKPAEALYLQLANTGLDPARVYQVRDASLERSAVHISLNNGTIAFTQDVMGRVTGAFFEGEGEVLISPPNDVERRSMSLFTGMAILEESFATAFFRFNDDAMNELRPDLRATDDAQQFVQKWDTTVRNLANIDAMRLLVSFGNLLPAEGSGSRGNIDTSDRMLHARLQGVQLGVFDVDYDSFAPEKVQVGQLRTAENGRQYYDVWTSFTPLKGVPVNGRFGEASESESSTPAKDPVAIRDYVISSQIIPPKQLRSDATLQVEIRQGSPRILIFELSRFLDVQSVEMNGKPVEFIHNPSQEGTQASRRGNDVVAVVLPQPASPGQKMKLHFVYAGDVLAEAGAGLLYVGARGTWYPNRGMSMADFDLTFRYPQGWTLVATGKSEAPQSQTDGEQRSHWVSERPIPVAGFDLGKYKVATAQAGTVQIRTYATRGVERDFPTSSARVVDPDITSLPGGNIQHAPRVEISGPDNPSPTRTQMGVAQAAAQAVEFYSKCFGPYPFGSLALTQMPGPESQGWPGLVFLSSYAFLSDQERSDLHFDSTRILIQKQIPAHETAHQWWGDLVGWSTYRDQWLSEALANYSSLMMLEKSNPIAFHQLMEHYREDLLVKNKAGATLAEAGPVTLGARLLSSRFPEGYEDILYGRGTWLFHMLRTMMQDAATQEYGHPPEGPDEPFIRGLRNIRERYQDKTISTRELFEAFAENLPPALRYEGKKSLDWFVVGWVNGTAVPRFELRNVRMTSHEGSLIVNGTILQKDSPDDLVTSIPLYAVLASKQEILLGRVFADGAESTFRIKALIGTRKIVIDPHQTVLARIN